MNLGTISMGIKCPIIREGDNLEDIVFNSVISSQNGIIEDGDVIGITESIVARSQGNYVTVDDISSEVKNVIGNKYIALWSPIMSRNRFGHILRGFARYCDKLIIFINDEYDEQGNPTCGINPYTQVDIQEYYRNICRDEHCELQFKSTSIYKNGFSPEEYGYVAVDARCHPGGMGFRFDLSDICSLPTDKHGYSNYGLLGSNVASKERLKLFPNQADAQEIVDNIQERFKKEFGKHVEVMIYGDGCFHSPDNGIKGSSIWEFADPVTSPAYTKGLEGCPSEVKIKNLADGKYTNYSGNELECIIKKEINSHNNSNGALGTTPRQYVDLLASLMDLTSGSGEKGTPIVLVRNYFKNYSN